MSAERIREALEPFARLSFEDGLMRGLDPEQFQAAVENANRALVATEPWVEGRIRDDLARVINRHCMENGSNTPDWILADYLCACLDAYDVAVSKRDGIARTKIMTSAELLKGADDPRVTRAVNETGSGRHA